MNALLLRERARLAAQGRRVSLDELVAMLLLHWQSYPPAVLPTRQEARVDVAEGGWTPGH